MSSTDRVTGRIVRRYEHPYPECPVHVDVKKNGNIPDSGGATLVRARARATAPLPLARPVAWTAADR